ncbi:MAG: hypothetical protein LT071_00410, partial [Nocardioides sp.]|nr:hypothetical protein [Nocardioides sp.]
MGGDRGEHRDDPSPAPDAQHTPTDVVPDVLTQAPTLSGRRTDEGVLFTWRPGTAPEPGDQWRWHRDDTDEFGHTAGRRLLVRTSRGICLDVVQVRGS